MDRTAEVNAIAHLAHKMPAHRPRDNRGERRRAVDRARQRIQALHRQGYTWRAIADVLHADGIVADSAGGPINPETLKTLSARCGITRDLPDPAAPDE